MNATLNLLATKQQEALDAFLAQQQSEREESAAREAEQEAQRKAEQDATAGLLSVDTQEAKSIVGRTMESDGGTCTVPFEGGTRVATVRALPPRVPAVELQAILNVGGVLALEVVQTAVMKALSQFWGLPYCEGFNPVNFHHIYQSLRSMGVQSGNMTKYSYKVLAPIARKLVRRAARKTVKGMQE